MKKIYTILATLLLVVASSFATTVTYDFESGDTDWYFVQTKQSNAWVRSTAAGSASTENYALHVSSGDNTYGYTNNYLSTSWVYGKLVTLTAESTISFSWKGYGEVDYNYMLVYLFPTMAVGTQEYKAGEEVSLLPIADEGYVFEKWMVNGSVKNTENLVLTMDEDYKGEANLQTTRRGCG